MVENLELTGKWKRTLVPNWHIPVSHCIYVWNLSTYLRLYQPHPRWHTAEVPAAKVPRYKSSRCQCSTLSRPAMPKFDAAEVSRCRSSTLQKFHAAEVPYFCVVATIPVGNSKTKGRPLLCCGTPYPDPMLFSPPSSFFLIFCLAKWPSI